MVLAFACIPFLLASCELFKKAQTTPGTDRSKEELDAIQGKRVYDPVTGVRAGREAKEEPAEAPSPSPPKT